MRPRLVVCVLAAVVLASACSVPRKAGEDVVGHVTKGDFYVVPAPLPYNDPGELIRSDRLLGAPDGAIAWRVMYHSRDANGNDIAVTGVVVAPTGPAPRNGRTVVAWAHPTTGTAPRCAPSSGLDPFDLIEGLRDLIRDGYVVTATDYSGMGATGPPSYLIGTTEAKNMFDSARAARHIPDTHAGKQLLLWGHSQGGHAALFAAQDGGVYAPETKLLGVAVAAPAVELAQLLQDDITDDSGVTIGSYAFDAYERAYGAGRADAGLTSILTPAGAAATPNMAKLCLFGDNKELHKIAGPLVGRYLSGDPAVVEPWATWLRENTPGAAPITVPIFVAQGETDTLVRPQTTEQYVVKLCSQRAHVRFKLIPDTGHGLVALKAFNDVNSWFRDLVAGHPVATTCPA
jgi:pimeloyl-ACP methyl ester carboxylesterase